VFSYWFRWQIPRVSKGKLCTRARKMLWKFRYPDAVSQVSDRCQEAAPSKRTRAAPAQTFVLGNLPFVWEINLALFSPIFLHFHSSNKFWGKSGHQTSLWWFVEQLQSIDKTRCEQHGDPDGLVRSEIVSADWGQSEEPSDDHQSVGKAGNYHNIIEV